MKSITAVKPVRQLFVSALILGATAIASNSWAEGLPDFRKLVEEEGGAVVSISVVRESLQPTAGNSQAHPSMPDELRRFFEQIPRGQSPEAQPGRGIGSGFIVSEDGYVVTNAHVVDGASMFSVTLDDRRQLTATLVGLDKATDIALLKVSATGLPVVELGDSDDVEVGEWVLAIGSPFGLDHTATQGIVSAVSRSLPSGGYTPFIQTDVAVNPGNSGGPLFNTDGQVIGVNSQIYSNSGGYQGLSFAIPVNVAMHVVEQLKTTGHASRGWLGVSIQDVNQDLADAFGLDSPRGALVSSIVDDGPADAAGIEAGDIIIAFNEMPIRRSSDLPALVGLVPAGESAVVTILRNDKERDIDVAIGEFDTEQLASSGNGMSVPDVLGLVVGTLDDKALQGRGIEHGVEVLAVLPDSAAAVAGITTGDVIQSLDGQSILDTRDYRKQVAGLEAGKSVAALVLRGDRSLYIALKVAGVHE
ncbi:MAG: DegQ family serine endoprotease [Granulosicoccus sp.]|nr:DegQ family serine endoprotease [Granulosicoccus sp.]